MVPFNDNRISVDIRKLKEGLPEFYSAAVEGKKVDFFVIRDAGAVTSYFDACKECYFKKMGYRYEKGHVVCKACNIRFPLDRLDTGIGGCYPIRLPGLTNGDIYIISREDLAAGLKYFP